MEREPAEAIRDRSLSAIADLTKILVVGERHCTFDELERLRRAIGDVIGRIQIDILDSIHADHPELNDLR